MNRKIMLTVLSSILLLPMVFGTQFIGSVWAGEPPIEIWTNYTLTRDITFSNDGFILKANGIVLDLNDHKIRGSGTGRGISAIGVEGVTIKNGMIEGFFEGIFLQNSHFNRIKNNMVKKNEWGIFADSSNNNVIESNTVYETTGDGIICPRSHNNIIRRNIAHHNKEGIDVAYPDGRDNIVEYNTVYSNVWYGIHLHKTCDNLVSSNIAYDNTAGIKIEEHAKGNIVKYNRVHENGGGIDMFFDCESNVVTENLIENNIYGSFIIDSAHNTISENTIRNNEYGIRAISHSDNNRIFHNNFVGNTIQAFCEQSANEFDNGYPSGGNYWSDYEERYPDAEELDGSGIWDTPYVIDDYNQDTYPIIGFPSKKSAVILNPFDFQVPNSELISKISGYLTDAGYTVSYIHDTGVTVELLKSVLEKGVIFWRGHSGVVSGDKVSFATGERVTESNKEKYKEDWEAGRITSRPVEDRPDDEYYWVIKPEFISHYYSSNQFPYSLVYVEGCYALKHGTMAEAFIENGAGAYVGYKEWVWPSFPLWWWSGDSQSEKAFYDFCRKGYTVEQVVDDIHTWYDPFCSLDWEGDGNLRLASVAQVSGSFGVTVHSPAQLLLTDPLGLHVGVDPYTGEVVNEIPSAIYSGPSSVPEVIVIHNPSTGIYKVDVFGTDTGTYTITFATQYPNGSIRDRKTYSDDIVEGAVYVYSVSIADEVMTTNPDPTAELEHLKDFIDGLPDDSFDKPKLASQWRNALFNKIDEVILKVEVNDYTDAINKLVHDVRAKMDGDSTAEDWIIDPETQVSLCIIIDHIISSLETLQPQPD